MTKSEKSNQGMMQKHRTIFCSREAGRKVVMSGTMARVVLWGRYSSREKRIREEAKSSLEAPPEF